MGEAFGLRKFCKHLAVDYDGDGSQYCLLCGVYTGKRIDFRKL